MKLWFNWGYWRTLRKLRAATHPEVAFDGSALWVPEQGYRRARAKVLESFLSRERLYHTAPYRRRCEGRARTNVERALARLRDG